MIWNRPNSSVCTALCYLVAFGLALVSPGRVISQELESRLGGETEEPVGDGQAAGRPTVGGSAAGPPDGLAAAVAIEQATIEAIARCERSVVSIARVSREDSDRLTQLDIRPDPFRAESRLPVQPTDPSFVPNEFATGVVLSAQGAILTNYHVLDADSEHYVTTVDRKVFQAEIKAADPRSDLAVLQAQGPIREGDFTPMPLGDAAQLKKGQIVIALGNPYAIARDGQASASWGIIANLARRAPAHPSTDPMTYKAHETLHQFGTLIQTDARLNLGTSGGALVNLRGEMVGLTTSAAAMAGFEQPAGYAIPVDDTFRRVIRSLMEGKEVEYGFLGIGPANLSQTDRLRGRDGVEVQVVRPGTPADEAGLRESDVILAVDGVAIHNTDGLMLQVGKHAVGSEVTLLVERDGKQSRRRVALAKFPAFGRRIVTSQDPAWRGVRVDYPSALPEVVHPEWFPYGGFEWHQGSVMVTEVAEGSLAWNSGLRRGMSISHVGTTPVKTPGEFHSATQGQLADARVRVMDATGGRVQTIPVE